MHRPIAIIAKKGKHTVSAATSAERGNTDLANVKREVVELQCKILQDELKFKEKEYNLKIND